MMLLSAILRGLAAVLETHETQTKQIMATLAELKAQTDRTAAAAAQTNVLVGKVIEKLNAPVAGISEADLQPAVDTLASSNAQLETANAVLSAKLG